jgi:hypothetical protein
MTGIADAAISKQLAQYWKEIEKNQMRVTDHS